MKRLALDLGSVRIGIAASDEGGSMAFSRSSLTRKSLDHDLQALAGFARDEGAAELVVGLPLRLDGSEGDRSAAARRFAAKLAQATGLEVRLQDERHSTEEAAVVLRGLGLDERKARSRIDAESARVILQRYLDRQPGEPQ